MEADLEQMLQGDTTALKPIHLTDLIGQIKEDIAVLSELSKGRESEQLGTIVQNHLALFGNRMDGNIDIFARAVAVVSSLQEVPAGLQSYADLFADKNVVTTFDLLFSPSKQLRSLGNKYANSLDTPSFTEPGYVASQTATPDKLHIVELAATAHKEYHNAEHSVTPNALPIDEKSAFTREDSTSQDVETTHSKLLESIKTHKDRVRSSLTDKAGDN